LLLSPAANARQAELSRAEEIVLKLGGTPPAFAYISTLLTRALELREYVVHVRNRGDIPTTRLEVMLERGEISAFILGPTPRRDQLFLPVHVGMTDGLVNRRILFIPQGSQAVYDQVKTLDDFKRLGKVAGLGGAWSDRDIWAANDLPVIAIGGDWKRLYQMVAARNRGMDYLPRGAHEIALEWPAHPQLQVERNLVLVYDQDHILYVSPADPDLHALLQEVLVEARDSGLIAELAADFFAAAFEPPVNMNQRRVIPLPLP
tara:strand:- start:35586 stop:36368 length:783 start_codon:yes stop_codon:yes gene_type:complete